MISDTFKTFIEEADRLVATDYSEFIDYANTYVYPIERQNEDPFSEQFIRGVLAEYKSIADVEAYIPAEHESSRLEQAPARVADQFPFLTHDAPTIGLYLMGVGFCISKLRVPSGSKVIEYGAGWGHLATALGQSGFDVTCVDIDSRFVELINRRAQAEGVRVEAILGQFGAKPPGVDSVDAVIFLEAFHHCLNHLEAIQTIQRFLRPGGEILFAAETIYPDFDCDWGIRRDGHAVWAIHKFKWMELGFNEGYFVRMLIRCGFSVEKITARELGPFGVIYRATKHETGKLTPVGFLPLQESATWNVPDGSRLCVGPDMSTMPISDLAGWKTVELELRNDSDRPVTVTLSVGSQHRKLAIDARASQRVVVPIADRAITLGIPKRATTALHGPNADLENAVVLAGISYR